MNSTKGRFESLIYIPNTGFERRAMCCSVRGMSAHLFRLKYKRIVF